MFVLAVLCTSSFIYHDFVLGFHIVREVTGVPASALCPLSRTGRESGAPAYSPCDSCCASQDLVLSAATDSGLVFVFFYAVRGNGTVGHLWVCAVCTELVRSVSCLDLMSENCFLLGTQYSVVSCLRPQPRWAVHRKHLRLCRRE